MYYYYYLYELYNIPAIQLAFKNICLRKMLVDGYFDMNEFIKSKITKYEFFAILSSSNSKYSILYKNKTPNSDDAYQFWVRNLGDEDVPELELIESSAIVHWVYKAIKTQKDREKFTENLLKEIKHNSNITSNAKFKNGIVFNDEKVEIKFISSLSEYSNLLTNTIGNLSDGVMLYRGHANANYILQPSINRNESLRANESNMYNELLIRCPSDFHNNSTHFEKLVKMQHYGLPTRLLDVTTNPLIALYFACENSSDAFGEVVLLKVDDRDIKYPNSDTVTILSSLAAFPVDLQSEFKNLALNPALTAEQFNRKLKRLIHEIRLEKPAFKEEVIQNDILDNFAVYATQSNQRIVKQDGAFILCGLGETEKLKKFRYKSRDKKLIVIIKNKSEILKALDSFSINRATLFPEIANIAEYIKKKFDK